ncbi:cell growth regulator with EF hand domain protein 1 [Clupea harengus]|uniref:Cell growth regulator with EF hand domain protein 1 n=1 Tax=Clupea harengus TaxID=7950 RepID=A0A8M1KJQ9_CLUHA|nr:cell growth regulator with EF hand domain protein 1 [Clupea harengus]
MFAVAAVLLVPFLVQGAPQQGQASERLESTGDSPPLPLVNPFGSADENRRLLQSYIKANLKKQANPDVTTWEQEVFFLFSLHDYDKSSQLDGLELMKLLSDFQSHHSQTPKSTDGVVAMVDYLLQTQDQNQDGLLAPSELLSPPIQAKLEEEAPQQQEQPEEEPAQKAEADRPSDTANELGQPQEEMQEGKQEHRPEAQEEQVPEEQNVDQPGDVGELKQGGEQEHAQEQPEPEAVQEQQQQAEEQRLELNAMDQQNRPVHQGQPEM